ncbi:hypothetical protein E2C01_014696 [Portunus trituberculatus]|uniref:Uncharacterized protein n=1 Tax=Portunus trituberculatus TaxID=210409 RepID=A0A5B7DL05_PORTR|nr:hypothetical protein [Portunus trituberculatus]
MQFPRCTVGVLIRRGNKLRKVRDQKILPLPARSMGECLDLSYPLCCCESKQKKGLPSQVSGGRELQRFKESLGYVAKHHIQVPGRSKIPGRPLWLGRAGSDNKLQHLVVVEIQSSDCQNAVKHGLVALDSRGGRMTNLSQINQENLRPSRPWGWKRYACCPCTISCTSFTNVDSLKKSKASYHVPRTVPP